MKIEKCNLDGLYMVNTDAFKDNRGFMLRLMDVNIFNELQINTDWKQESLSFTAQKNTIRGLHVSLVPMESKTITALTGVVQWISVDIRMDSPTFGQTSSNILDSENHGTLYAEKGFAHGCLSLTDNCLLLLRADERFEDITDTGMHWADPDLNIDWKVEPNHIISQRDDQHNSFQELKKKLEQ